MGIKLASGKRPFPMTCNAKIATAYSGWLMDCKSVWSPFEPDDCLKGLNVLQCTELLSPILCPSCWPLSHIWLFSVALMTRLNTLSLFPPFSSSHSNTIWSRPADESMALFMLWMERNDREWIESRGEEKAVYMQKVVPWNKWMWCRWKTEEVWQIWVERWRQ